jgi:hypothetical protein
MAGHKDSNIDILENARSEGLIPGTFSGIRDLTLGIVFCLLGFIFEKISISDLGNKFFLQFFTINGSFSILIEIINNFILFVFLILFSISIIVIIINLLISKFFISGKNIFLNHDIIIASDRRLFAIKIVFAFIFTLFVIFGGVVNFRYDNLNSLNQLYFLNQIPGLLKNFGFVLFMCGIVQVVFSRIRCVSILKEIKNSSH